MLNDVIARKDAEQFRPVIMWFWDDRIDENEVCRQIKEFRKSGINEFFIHPMYCFEEEYLSDRFFNLIKVAVDEAKSLEMKFWIYDEYNWPSGVAGGYVLRDYPEMRSRVLRFETYHAYQGQMLNLSLEGEICAAFVMYGNRYKRLNLSEICNPDGTMSWINNETSIVQLGVFYEKIQGGLLAACMWSPFCWQQEGYLDTSNPDAVKTFIEYTHEKYKAKIGDEFGKTVSGVFTDEVCLSSPFDLKKHTLPWTKDFLVAFEKEKGYDLANRLLEMIIPVGNFVRTRWDYWDVLSGRFSDSFFKQVAKWCESHNLLLTGHSCGEEYLLTNLLQSGSFARCMKHFQLPGIDSILSKQNIERDDFNVAGKLISSLAHQLGRDRVLCETYTGSGWDCTLNDMKRIFNRLAVMGVNMLQFMGAYYSIRGPLKSMPGGYPPSHSFQRPLWRHYLAFSDYVSQICSMLSAGRHMSEIGVLYPESTSWCEFDFSLGFWEFREAPTKHPLLITDYTVRSTVNALLSMHREFDFVFEETFEHVVVKDGRLVVGDESYTCLICPGVTTLTRKGIDVLKDFVTSGGRVIFINYLPDKSPDGNEVVELARQSLGLDPCEVRNQVEQLFAGDQKSTLSSCVKASNVAHIMTNQGEPDNNAEFIESLNEELSAIPQYFRVNEACKDLYVTTRELEDGSKVFFVANDSSSEIDVVAQVNGKGKLYQMTPGEENCIYSASTVDNGLRDIDIALPPHGSQFVFMGDIDEERLPIVQRKSDCELKSIIVLDSDWDFEVDGGNYKRLDWEVMVYDDLQENRKWLPAHGGQFPTGAGFEFGITYMARSEFEMRDTVADLSVVFDELEDIKVLVNGKQVLDRQTEIVWDKGNIVFDIADKVDLGKNVIEFKSRISSWSGPHVLPFAALMGSFILDEDTKLRNEVSTIKVGSWSEQGYPYYSGCGIYATHFILEEELCDAVSVQLVIEDLEAAAEVFVNGQRVGAALWRPYTFNISRYVFAGRNELRIEVVNTLANLFVEQRPSGLLGKVEIKMLEQGALVS